MLSALTRISVATYSSVFTTFSGPVDKPISAFDSGFGSVFVCS